MAQDISILRDMLAHHVSAITVQAQAGLVLARSSDNAVIDALETINHEAVRTLEEMRIMVGILRNHSHQPPSSPLRQMADIERLATTGNHSLRVDVELRGDLTNLPMGLETAFFRVAQEAVTNAKRHARLSDAQGSRCSELGALENQEQFAHPARSGQHGCSPSPGLHLRRWGITIHQRTLRRAALASSASKGRSATFVW